MVLDRFAQESEDPRLAAALECARAMGPTVEAEAKASEEAGTLTPKVVETFRDSGLLRAFLPEEIDELMREPATPWSAVDRWSSPAAGISDRALQAMFLDQRLYLAEGVLQKVDRASMAVSLEARVPLLDHRFVERFAHLPAPEKVDGSRGKHRLREALQRVRVSGEVVAAEIEDAQVGQALLQSDRACEDVETLLTERVI